jgi:hypothetical protein
LLSIAHLVQHDEYELLKVVEARGAVRRPEAQVDALAMVDVDAQQGRVGREELMSAAAK